MDVEIAFDDFEVHIRRSPERRRRHDQTLPITHTKPTQREGPPGTANNYAEEFEFSRIREFELSGYVARYQVLRPENASTTSHDHLTCLPGQFVDDALENERTIRRGEVDRLKAELTEAREQKDIALEEVERGRLLHRVRLFEIHALQAQLAEARGESNHDYLPNELETSKPDDVAASTESQIPLNDAHKSELEEARNEIQNLHARLHTANQKENLLREIVDSYKDSVQGSASQIAPDVGDATVDPERLDGEKGAPSIITRPEPKVSARLLENALKRLELAEKEIKWLHIESNERMHTTEDMMENSRRHVECLKAALESEGRGEEVAHIEGVRAVLESTCTVRDVFNRLCNMIQALEGRLGDLPESAAEVHETLDKVIKQLQLHKIMVEDIQVTIAGVEGKAEQVFTEMGHVSQDLLDNLDGMDGSADERLTRMIPLIDQLAIQHHAVVKMLVHENGSESGEELFSSNSNDGGEGDDARFEPVGLEGGRNPKPRLPLIQEDSGADRSASPGSADDQSTVNDERHLLDSTPPDVEWNPYFMASPLSNTVAPTVNEEAPATSFTRTDDAVQTFKNFISNNAPVETLPTAPSGLTATHSAELARTAAPAEERITDTEDPERSVLHHDGSSDDYVHAPVLTDVKLSGSSPRFIAGSPPAPVQPDSPLRSPQPHRLRRSKGSVSRSKEVSHTGKGKQKEMAV